MKLAHLILAHNNPDQLARLVNGLSHPDADIYIHLDAKADPAPFTAVIGPREGVYLIENRVKVAWGEYSTIQGTLNGMEEILASGKDYSHINLLSGNDYPLQSAAEIQRFLFAHADKTFMLYDPIPEGWIHGAVRINTRYYGDYGFPGRYHLGGLVNRLLPKRKVPLNLTPYGRSQWLSITPDCTAYVLEYVRLHPRVRRFFRKTWAVDEVFFQTILCNSPLRNALVNDNLRHIVMDEEFRPVVWTMGDAETLTNSGKFYARKFDNGKDKAIFDYLDNRILQPLPEHS